MFEEIEWLEFTPKPSRAKAYQFTKENLYHGTIYPAGSWLVNDGQTITVLPDTAFKAKYE